LETFTFSPTLDSQFLTRPVLHPQDVDEYSLNGVTHRKGNNDENGATALAGAVRLARSSLRPQSFFKEGEQIILKFQTAHKFPG